MSSSCGWSAPPPLSSSSASALPAASSGWPPTAASCRTAPMWLRGRRWTSWPAPSGGRRGCCSGSGWSGSGGSPRSRVAWAAATSSTMCASCRWRCARSSPSAAGAAGFGFGRSKRPCEDRGMARVLVTEEIAEGGLDRLRDAGHDVDVRLGLSADELLDVVPGAHALIIRSATKVTAEVLDAGTDLVVVGRAGIGLDNVDVDHATKRGVMVVNAPQSNILSAAEHTMALLLAQARNVPQAHAALVAGRWERSRWEGVELADKVLGIVGLGRIGKLVAQRASAFGMRLIAYDPFVAPSGPDSSASSSSTSTGWSRRPDFVTIHVTKTKETDRPHRQGPAGQGQARHPHHQRRPRRHRRRGRAGRRDPLGPRRRCRPRRVHEGADHRVAAVRAARGGGHAAPRRVDARGAGQGRRHDRRAGRPRAGRRVRAVRRQRVGGRGIGDRAPVPPARRAASAGSTSRSTRACPRRSRWSTRASSPTTTRASSRCRC